MLLVKCWFDVENLLKTRLLEENTLSTLSNRHFVDKKMLIIPIFQGFIHFSTIWTTPTTTIITTLY